MTLTPIINNDYIADDFDTKYNSYNNSDDDNENVVIVIKETND